MLLCISNSFTLLTIYSVLGDKTMCYYVLGVKTVSKSRYYFALTEHIPWSIISVILKKKMHTQIFIQESKF